MLHIRYRDFMARLQAASTEREGARIVENQQIAIPRGVRSDRARAIISRDPRNVAVAGVKTRRWHLYRDNGARYRTSERRSNVQA